MKMVYVNDLRIAGASPRFKSLIKANALANLSKSSVNDIQIINNMKSLQLSVVRRKRFLRREEL